MNAFTKQIRAATLAVGTEVTDGQILDRNSAWVSQKLVEQGLRVIEHRAVADDRDDITRALKELTARVDFLFVTGGLGPTSDDFTRDLLSSVYAKPLEFHEESWMQIHEKLKARGITVRPIQKQQCYYPEGSKVLTNPAGTANAFTFEGSVGGKSVRVYALPGPPIEIAAVWELHIAQEISRLVPESERDELRIFRCLGRGESDVAELVEKLILDSGLRVGYRAHLPYVEVKLWFKKGERTKVQPALDRTEAALKNWIVNYDHEDVTDRWLEVLNAGQPIRVQDHASGGWLADRLIQRLRERKMNEALLPLSIETHLGATREQAPVSSGETFVHVLADEDQNSWAIRLKTGDGIETVLEEKPPYNYKVRSERGRKYITEKVLALVSARL